MAKQLKPPKPPRRPFFGVQLSPVVILAAVLFFALLGLLICFVTDPSFMPRWRPDGIGW